MKTAIEIAEQILTSQRGAIAVNVEQLQLLARTYLAREAELAAVEKILLTKLPQGTTEQKENVNG